MNLEIGIILAHRYPNLDPTADYEVGVDENGNQYIAIWDETRLGPQPTEAELVGGWLPALKAHKAYEMQRAFAAECERDFSSPFEALAIFATNVRDPKVDALKTRLTKLTDKIAYINDPARTETELTQLTWH